jgi:hypothetical protein
MGTKETIRRNHIIFFVFIVGIWAVWGFNNAPQTSSASGSPHKVHVAFGFHVNLYHSFRGDTNDENGFGQDIRVIRHTLRTLDDLNGRGIPVRAVWDFDNLFSLQELLPEHAPDIIADVQRRVKENKDEVMLMSYNNGMVSAMNHEEFMISVERAISNEDGSGIQDLFGNVAPVIRPQEMMTTPGHFERYKALGIETISLYYSATPFDAFRLFSRKLTPTEAYNPVQYINPKSGEEIIVLPTYHAGDLVEHISLRNWVETLHNLQIEGEIDKDVLIFINFDADAEFWTGADLPWHLDWLPNTGGLQQLVESVSDLAYVAFSNLTDYLSKTPPTGTIHFGQDTADGSFHGYHSWAEKAYASDYWTRIVRNRRIHRAVRNFFSKSEEGEIPQDLKALLRRSFETRMRALSTTNFGLASPFLARQRESVMADLLDALDKTTDELHRHLSSRVKEYIKKATPPNQPPFEGEWVETFYLLNQDLAKAPSGDHRLDFTLPAGFHDGGRFHLMDTNGQSIPLCLEKSVQNKTGKTATITFRVSKHHELQDDLYFLFHEKQRAQNPASSGAVASTRLLINEFIAIHLDEHGHVDRVIQNGRQQLNAKSLMPYIRYKGKRLTPEKLHATVEESGKSGVASIRIQGTWEGPKGATRASGGVDYRLRLVKGVPYLFVDGEVQYPDTVRRDLQSPEKPMLARKIDAGWEAVAPLELRFAMRADAEHPFIIHKRNFLGKEDAYAVDYYRHSPNNLNVASINNHITAAYTAVTASGHGMAIAMNPTVMANFAFCPFKMAYQPERKTFSISANPFGTYDGEQLTPPTRGNGQGNEAVRLTAPQLKSAGPTYNGHRDRFDLMISFFEGDEIPTDIKGDLLSFADRPLTVGAHASKPQEFQAAKKLPPAGFMALPYNNGILFHWDDPGVPGARVKVRLGCPALQQSYSFTAKGQTHFVAAPELMKNDNLYSATIQTLYADGNLSEPSPEIRFRLTDGVEPAIDLPNSFKAQVLWANVSAWADRFF